MQANTPADRGMTVPGAGLLLGLALKRGNRGHERNRRASGHIRPEHRAHAGRQSTGAQGSAETDGGQGVAAGFEEVVVRVHGHAQVIDGLTSPDQWECRLNAPPRREAGELAVVRLRFRPSR
ncbi:hypothetical protein SUDANB51_00971 [Streptomyces sp. enrichment culture]